MRSSLAFGLVFLASACSSEQDNTVHAKYGDMEPGQAFRVSGDWSVCTVDVLGLDDDLDGYAVEASSTDIFADNSSGFADYICLDLAVSGAPKHYIVIASASDVGLDCNDGDAAINPAATEVCDSVDNDCDGSVDESGGSSTFYADADSDTYGDASATSTACTMPAGYVADNTDCDDSDSDINPAAAETCDSIDNDCDGAIDDDDTDVIDASTWYADGDSDGYGGTTTADACDAPAGYVATSTDCDDSSASVNPAATEISFDGVSNNCGAANATAAAYICGEPVTDWASVPWQFWVRDGTTDTDGSATATWASPGANQGTGQLCATVTVVNGDTEYFNAPFDVDGDGTFGESFTDGDGAWGFMLDATLVDTAAYTADGYAITVTSTCWDGSTSCTTGGMDGRWVVNTQ